MNTFMKTRISFLPALMAVLFVLTSTAVIGVGIAHAQYDDSSYSGGGTYYDDSLSSGSGTYYDDSASTGGTYYDDATCNCGTGTYYDDAATGGTYYDDAATGGTYYDDVPTYNSDCGCYESSASTAYQTSQGYSYSTGGQTSYHATPMTIVPPTYYTTPVTYRPSTPSYPTYPVQPVSNTTVNTNTKTCLYNSCNTSYTDNSINGSFNTNTAPVYVATPQPIVQYVYPQNYNYQTYSQAPFCSITIGAGYQTGMTNLTWSSSGATSAYISPNVGTVNVNGTTNIYSYGNTVYSLTVTGPGGTYTCRTQSYIAPVAPIAPYVSLSQIPYTGFDFGPFGNALYWMGLLAFAVAGAYLVVYYQGGALALAGNMLGGRTVSYAETTTETIPAHTEVEVAHEVSHEAPVAHFNLPTMSAASTKDSMTVAHTADGVPRIIITRN